jgi:hypothetical protein
MRICANSAFKEFIKNRKESVMHTNKPVISVVGLAAAAMTGNLRWAISGHEPWALLNYLSRHFNYFPSIHSPDIVKESVRDPWRAAFVAVVKDGRIDIARWINATGNITDHATYVEALIWAAHIGRLAMIKWLIEDSGQILDCRELPLVHGNTYFNPHQSKQLNECREYLAAVAETQAMVGLAGWKKANDYKQAAHKPLRKL